MDIWQKENVLLLKDISLSFEYQFEASRAAFDAITPPIHLFL